MVTIFEKGHSVSRRCPESRNETRPSTQKAGLWTRTPETRTDNAGDLKKKRWVSKDLQNYDR